MKLLLGAHILIKRYRINSTTLIDEKAKRPHNSSPHACKLSSAWFMKRKELSLSCARCTGAAQRLESRLISAWRCAQQWRMALLWRKHHFSVYAIFLIHGISWYSTCLSLWAFAPKFFTCLVLDAPEGPDACFYVTIWLYFQVVPTICIKSIPDISTIFPLAAA